LKKKGRRKIRERRKKGRMHGIELLLWKSAPRDSMPSPGLHGTWACAVT
jgi:hypothetical protein